ncbi:transposase [Komarekiella delphini-convector]|uniref:transposase n=1 Tax=Komarekiella delphini-convector TaxID=3050158 RepID=UPI0021E54061|nr:transposase [Komarekiella delphini-convector]
MNPCYSRYYRPRNRHDLPGGQSQRRDLRWDTLSTQEWLQLGRLTQRCATLLNRLLALQAVASSRGVGESDKCLTWTSARAGKKKPKWTTLMIIDSQAVKNTCNASVDSKGFCFYKSTNGIKRHLAIDTLGFPLFTHCTPANVSDDAGLIEMFTLNIDYFKSKPVNIPKITILLDHGYHPKKFDSGVRADLSSDDDENQV